MLLMLSWLFCSLWMFFPKVAGGLSKNTKYITIYCLTNFNNNNNHDSKDTRALSEPVFTCSKSTIETEQLQWLLSGVFIANCEQISHIVLVFSLLTLGDEMAARLLVNCPGSPEELSLFL